MARDQAYIAQQKVAHNEALTIHQSYGKGGKNMVANKTVPAVQHHVELLKTTYYADSSSPFVSRR